ncbi:MAG: metallopeptidase [Eubacteriaceae bacterium]|nr:metallopeptidase [Eubacteriaceae bacterium]
MDVLRKTETLCEEILNMCRANLFIKQRYLDVALFNFEFKAASDISAISSDGRVYNYNPRYIINSYKEDKDKVSADYLHCVLHFVFKHPFVGQTIDRRFWNLACDIACESVANNLGSELTHEPRSQKQREACAVISRTTGIITAEKVYDYLCTTPLAAADIFALETLFVRDDHSLWYPGESGGEPKDGEGGESEPEKESGNMPEGNIALSREEWEEISERIKIDLESSPKDWGDISGGIIQNIEEVTRDKYDYTSFLKKFAFREERLKINEDEFDYVFYTYGLNLYKNMPLIEPLEYKEIKQIKQFVIALDTSGSCHGKTIQQFLNKTYSILMAGESFTQKVNIHIIQCDAAVQNDYKITNRREFDDYIRDMTLSGFGGTDFRPVFEYVDKLVEKREFSKLNGLIYFTDGYGHFPRRRPNYPVAFIFLEEGAKKPDVPIWAMKMVLNEKDIANLK